MIDSQEMTKERTNALRKVPACVELDQWEETWGHLVFRVEHPVCIFSEGEDTYTRREALACQRWLKRYAPESEYADLPL